MDTLSALFSAMWQYLTGASWFQAIQWPFWACLFLLAFGGVYTARIRKNTLFCRGITGALKLTMIYLVIVLLYKLAPGYMCSVSEYPFLSMSESALTLVNPLKLFDRSYGAIAEVYVRLYFLLFLVNVCGSFDYNGKNPLSWAGSQGLSCLIAVVVYEMCSYVLALVFDKLSMGTGLFFTVVAIILLLPMCILLLMKICFIVFRKAGNPTYASVMQFLTTQKFGCLFSVTLFSSVSFLAVLIAANAWDIGHIRLSAFSWMAYVLIFVMTTLTLYVFSQYYTERKY